MNTYSVLDGRKLVKIILEIDLANYNFFFFLAISSSKLPRWAQKMKNMIGGLRIYPGITISDRSTRCWSSSIISRKHCK